MNSQLQQDILRKLRKIEVEATWIKRTANYEEEDEFYRIERKAKEIIEEVSRLKRLIANALQ